MIVALLLSEANYTSVSVIKIPTVSDSCALFPQKTYQTLPGDLNLWNHESGESFTILLLSLLQVLRDNSFKSFFHTLLSFAKIVTKVAMDAFVQKNAYLDNTQSSTQELFVSKCLCLTLRDKQLWCLHAHECSCSLEFSV